MYERYYFVWLLFLLIGIAFVIVAFPAIALSLWGVPYAVAVEVGGVLLAFVAILAWR